MIELLNQTGAGLSSSGAVGAQLLANNMDVNILRPWIGGDGRSYVSQSFVGNDGKVVQKAVPLNNATGTLRKYEWLQIDEVVIKAARNRLRLVSDVRGAGLEYRVNGMSKVTLETATQTKIGKATLSMDPARISESDRPEYDTTLLPLPICHYDFYFNLREIAVSRNGQNPLDTVMVEQAGISVAEELEQLTLGTLPTYSYGGGTIYGLTNFPGRITTILTNPTHSSWTGHQLVQEVLDLRQQSMNHKRYGPWVLYVSPNWAEFLDSDYSALKGENTVRQRILAVDGLQDIRQLDYLTGYQMILVQMTSQNIRMVVGLELTTIQWDTVGGMRQNFKVMALMVPQLRTDIDGNTGIIHGTAT